MNDKGVNFSKVGGANLVNGLLTIDLKREIPEEMKPRRIEIKAATPQVGQRQIDGGHKQAA
jgi:molecular chaperone IbpA